MAITRKDLPALQQGANAITEGRNQKQLAALQAYLAPIIAGQKQSAENDENLKTFQDPRLQALLNQGGMAKVGDITAGADPSAHLLGKQQSGEDAAYKHAVDIYQKGVQSAGTSVQALHTMLGALQSNDPSSMGQIRTAMVLANGFKRYNDNEGTALTPDDKQADVSGLLAKYGIGMKDNTLSDTTRSNVVRFANNKLDDLQDAHNTLKSQAQGAYAGSRFADSQKAANLGAQLGGPVDQQLNQMKQRFDQFHSKALPDKPAQGSDAPSQGLGGYFKNLGSALFGGGQQSQAPAPQQQQSGLSGYLKGPSAGGQPQPQSAAGAASQAAQAMPQSSVQGAQQTGPHGPAVVQNGVTYKWNPQTQNYE
jgi:hypothetical protein